MVTVGIQELGTFVFQTLLNSVFGNAVVFGGIVILSFLYFGYVQRVPIDAMIFVSFSLVIFLVTTSLGITPLAAVAIVGGVWIVYQLFIRKFG